MSTRFALLLTAVLSTIAATAGGQALSIVTTVSGVVSDDGGGRLPNAIVEAVSEETGLRRNATTDDTGFFVIRGLPPGHYRVRVSLDGFEPRESEPITLAVASPATFDVTLKVAGQRYELAVVGSRTLADVQRPGLGGVIDRTEFDRLPVDVRGYLSFSLLVPGSAPDRTPQQGASRTSGLVFSGQRARANNIVVDGLDNNDAVVGSVRAGFSQEAVQQFQVLANGFSAEFGKASGGVVNIVTRSGSNRIDGSGFLYYRDDALSARNYFEKHTPAATPIETGEAPYDHYQFGGTFGGPVKRDRTFLFGSIERLDLDASNFVTIDDTVPVPDPTRPGATFGTAVDILRHAGFPVETGHVPYRVRFTQWLVKLDHGFNPGQHATVRVNGATELNENIEPFGGLVARSRGAALDNTDVLVAGTHSWMIGRRLSNDARMLMARRDQIVRSLDPTCSGLCDGDDEGGPTLEIAEVAAVGRQRFTPTPRDDTHYQFADTISLASARHVLKAGADINLSIGRDQALPLHFGGRYILASLPAIPGVLPVPVSSIQALALGLPAAYVQGYGNPTFLYDTGDVSVFAEDTWTPRSNLTVRYGLRYQRQQWPDVTYRVPGVPQPYVFPTDANDLAPRIAASWTPRPATIVRGGYGVYYDNVITAVAGIAHNISGQADGVRTVALGFPSSIVAWSAPGHRLSESAAAALTGGSFPSVVIPIDPGMKTSYAHHVFAGVDHQLPRAGTVALTGTYVRGFNQLGTIDYNPILPALGPRRRPLDIDGVAGTSASVLQYTSFGETWYRALTGSYEAAAPAGTSVRAFYTLSWADDTATDFQSAFLPQDNGRGRDPGDVGGLPIGFQPRLERGPAVQDQRHRLVLSAISTLPRAFAVAAVVNAASGWPYNILAGRDLNGDGDGGSFPSDRARRDPADAASSVERNQGRLPSQVTVDVRLARPIRRGRTVIEPTLDVLNLFNRTNFVSVQNVFGVGAFPSQPSSTYGQFTQAAPGRQLQLGVRVQF